MSTPLLFVLFLPATLVAQNLIVVDGLNRPGTQFTDLPAAEAAAQDGDTLLLRGGSVYRAVHTSKAITIAGDERVFPLPIDTSERALRVSGLPSGKRFVLCGVNFTGHGLPTVQVEACAGEVVITGCQASQGGPMFEVSGCTSVLIQGCSSVGGPTPTVVGRQSNLVLSDCGFGGGYAPPTPALDLRQCTALISRCLLFGGSGNAQEPPAPALFASNSQIILGAAGQPLANAVAAGLPGLGTGAASAIVGQDSTVRLDPEVRVTATNGAPLFQGVAVVTARFPSLSAVEVAANAFAFTHGSAPGAIPVFLLGAPGRILSSPAFTGTLWLDPLQTVVQVGVPPVLAGPALPFGTALLAQVVSVSATSVELSNPVGLVTR